MARLPNCVALLTAVGSMSTECSDSPVVAIRGDSRMMICIRYSLASLSSVLLGISILFAGASRADEILDPPEIVVDVCEDLPEEATLTERIALGCAEIPPPPQPPPVDTPPKGPPPTPPPSIPPVVPSGPPGVGDNTPGIPPGGPPPTVPPVVVEVPPVVIPPPPPTLPPVSIPPVPPVPPAVPPVSLPPPPPTGPPEVWTSP